VALPPYLPCTYRHHDIYPVLGLSLLRGVIPVWVKLQ
jgi:hypothetical protein